MVNHTENHNLNRYSDPAEQWEEDRSRTLRYAVLPDDTDEYNGFHIPLPSWKVSLCIVGLIFLLQWGYTAFVMSHSSQARTAGSSEHVSRSER